MHRLAFRWLAVIVALFVSLTPAAGQYGKHPIADLTLSAWDGRGDPLPQPSPAGEDAEAALARLGGWRGVLRLDSDIPAALTAELRDVVRAIMRDNRVGYTGLVARGGVLELRPRDGVDRARVVAQLARISPPWVAPEDRVHVHDPGDGPIRLVPGDAMVEERRRVVLRATIETIERRVREMIPSARVRAIGRDRFLVVAPGLTDPRRWPALHDMRAHLRIGLIERPDAAAGPGREGEWAAFDPTLRWLDANPALPPVERLNAEDRLRFPETGIADAVALLDPDTGAPMVAFRLRVQAIQRFADITGRHTGRRLGFALQDDIFARAAIGEEVPHGRAKLTGALTAAQAHEIALHLRVGILPGSVSVVEEQIVAPAPIAGK